MSGMAGAGDGSQNPGAGAGNAGHENQKRTLLNTLLSKADEKIADESVIAYMQMKGDDKLAETVR